MPRKQHFFLPDVPVRMGMQSIKGADLNGTKLSRIFFQINGLVTPSTLLF